MCSPGFKTAVLGHTQLIGLRHTLLQVCIRNGLGGWPLPTIGGRLRIARNPNQGIFCSRGQKTLKNKRFWFVFQYSLKTA
jgi:hypothetical protein